MGPRSATRRGCRVHALQADAAANDRVSRVLPAQDVPSCTAGRDAIVCTVSSRIAGPQHRPAAGRRAEEKPLHLFSDVHVGQHGAGDGVGGQALPRSSGCVWPRSHQPISSDAFMRIARIRRRATRRSKSWLVVHRRRRPRCKRSKRRVASTFMTMTSASLRTSMRLRRKWPASARRSCEHWRNARMPSC